MSSISLIQKPNLDLVALVFDCCTDEVWDGNSFEDVATQGLVFPSSSHYQAITSELVISAKQSMYSLTPSQAMIDASENGCLKVMFFDVTDDQSDSYGCLAGSGCFETCGPADTGCTYEVKAQNSCYAPGDSVLITATKKCNGVLSQFDTAGVVARINGIVVPLTYLATGIHAGIGTTPNVANNSIVLVELQEDGNNVCASVFTTCNETDRDCLEEIKGKLSGDAPACEQGELTPQEMLVGLYEYVICDGNADTGTGTGGSSVWTAAQVATALTCLSDIKQDIADAETNIINELGDAVTEIITEGNLKWVTGTAGTAGCSCADIGLLINTSETNILNELGDAVTEIITEGNNNWTTGSGGTTTWTVAEKAALIQCVTDLKTDVAAIPTTCPSIDTTPIITAIDAQTTHGDSNWSTGSGGTTTWTPAEKATVLQCLTDLKTDVASIPTSCPSVDTAPIIAAINAQTTHGDSNWSTGSGGTTTWTPAEKATVLQCLTDLKTDVGAIPTTCPSVDTTPIIAAINAQTTHGDSNWSTGSGGTTTWTPTEKADLIQCVTDLKTDVAAIPTSCPDCNCTGGGGTCNCPSTAEIQMLLSACKTEIVTHGDTHWTCQGGSGGTPAGNVHGCC